MVAGEAGLRRMDPVDAWLPVAALAFAAMPGIRTDDWLVTADLLLAGTLTAGTIACLAGARITRGLVPAILTLAMGLVVGAITGAIPTLDAARPASPPDDEGPGVARVRLTAGARRATPVLRGLLLAVPVVALFGLLFASADAVFAELARSTLDVAPRRRPRQRGRPYPLGRRRGLGHGRPAGDRGGRASGARAGRRSRA